jgi:hypothetical protein
MTPYHIAIVAIAIITFGFSCWLIFWTQSAVELVQTINKSRDSSITHRPWYPLWVRFEGIWTCVMVLFMLSIIFRR